MPTESDGDSGRRARRTTVIRPAEEIEPVLVGRAEATVLRARIERLAHVDYQVTVDFSGVITVSPSFADELFAKLDSALIDNNRVAFENLPASVASIARYVRSGRSG